MKILFALALLALASPVFGQPILRNDFTTNINGAARAVVTNIASAQIVAANAITQNSTIIQTNLGRIQAQTNTYPGEPFINIASSFVGDVLRVRNSYGVSGRDVVIDTDGKIQTWGALLLDANSAVSNITATRPFVQRTGLDVAWGWLGYGAPGQHLLSGWTQTGSGTATNGDWPTGQQSFDWDAGGRLALFNDALQPSSSLVFGYWSGFPATNMFSLTGFDHASSGTTWGAYTNYNSSSSNAPNGGITVRATNGVVLINAAFSSSGLFTANAGITSVGADNAPLLTVNGSGGNGFSFQRSGTTGGLLIQGTQVGNNDIYLGPTSGNTYVRSLFASGVSYMTNGLASYATNRATISTTGWTNTLGKSAQIFGLTGVSIVRTNHDGVGFSYGTVTAPFDATLQPGEFINGTSIAAAQIRAF